MAVLGILLMLCAGVYLAGVVITNSLDTQLEMFGTTVDGLTNAWVFLIGAAAGFTLALGMALTIAGLSRRSRARRHHREALARQRAETERLAAELERERATRQEAPVGYDAHEPQAGAGRTSDPRGEETAVVYPNSGTAQPQENSAYRNG